MKLFSLTETVFSRAWQLRLTGGGMTAVFSLFPRISTKTFTYYFHLHEKFMTNETKLSEFDFKSLLGNELFSKMIILRNSTYSHPFQISLPTSRTPSHKSSFIRRTYNIWNVLLSSCLPGSYNLPSFQSKINKLDLVPLSLISLSLSSFFLCWGFV